MQNFYEGKMFTKHPKFEKINFEKLNFIILKI